MRYFIVLKEKIIPALFGGLAIFLVSFLLRISIGNAILFASLGASTVILTEFPDTRTAKLRVVILSYGMAAGIGYALSFVDFVPLAAGLAVFFTIVAMALTDNIHAPAGGLALAFVFYEGHLKQLFYVLVAVLLLLTFLKSIIYMYKKELHIKKFHHEFLK
jgi:CBS-domain-containing membrane protein